jgi:hypothetical protein
MSVILWLGHVAHMGEIDMHTKFSYKKHGHRQEDNIRRTLEKYCVKGLAGLNWLRTEFKGIL